MSLFLRQSRAASLHDVTKDAQARVMCLQHLNMAQSRILSSFLVKNEAFILSHTANHMLSN